MPDDGKRSGYQPAGIMGLVFVVIYLFFPVLLVLPLTAVYQLPQDPCPPAVQWAFRLFFAPVIYLDKHVPAYHDSIETEARLGQAGVTFVPSFPLAPICTCQR